MNNKTLRVYIVANERGENLSVFRSVNKSLNFIKDICNEQLYLNDFRKKNRPIAKLNNTTFTGQLVGLDNATVSIFNKEKKIKFNVQVLPLK